ncbi:MAG TPA: lantibiotic dehydratase family protein, partial [Thermoanaerobaculia bacterium]|nr:lantibiotic dehydratase family protein [Thermoanaerobaculia bacterium]
MRTPLLPIDELSAWTEGLRSPQLRDDDPAFDDAVTHDAAMLRERLARIVARPEIAEAIFLASPDLVESIDAWRRDPRSKKARRTEEGLVRYLLRMIARPAPFGLFAGCAPASVAPHTQLLGGDRGAWRRHSRLDMDYLFALCEEVVRDHAVRAALTFRPNATLYEAAGRLRFAESRVHGRLRTYQLVAVDSFEALRTALDSAAAGGRLHELAQALVASDPDGRITRDDAESFLHDLVDNQLLVPDFGVPLTGEEGTSDLLRQLRCVRVAWAVCARLEQASALLREIDDGGLGAAPERYRQLAQILEPLGVPVAMSRLVQVDLTRAASEPLAIGKAIVDETLRAIDVLARFPRMRGRFPCTRERALDEFRAAFIDRYGSGREIPLLEALDEECGIGFDRSPLAGVAASPLLAGLPFEDRHDATRSEWSGAEAAMLRVYARALSDRAHAVELTDDDLKLIERRDTPPLPDALHAMVTVVAPSAAAVDRGEFRLLFHGAMGPSGARMLGRFCHADPAIEAGVRAHLAQEEALAPDAVFAEIVHLPAGRIGNILARPQLRDHEIAFLGRSGAPPERQIALSDLLVSIRGDRIHLRSKRLGREVIPRLTNAHD